MSEEIKLVRMPDGTKQWIKVTTEIRPATKSEVKRVEQLADDVEKAKKADSKKKRKQ